MVTEQKQLNVYVLSLLDSGYGSKQVEAYLEEHGYDVKLVKEVVREMVKTRRNKMLLKFLTLVLAFAIICIVSSVVVNSHAFSQATLP